MDDLDPWPVADIFANLSLGPNATVQCSVPVGCFLRYSVPLTVAYCVAYGVVLVVGLVGNACAFAVVMRDRALHSAYYRFMANLAVADLLVLIFCLPVTLLGNLFGPWILGLFLCKAVAYLQGVSVCASVHTLVAIAVDRYLAICYPMTWQITSRGYRCIIAAIWVFSFSLALPWTVYFRLIPIGRTDVATLAVCREVWPSERLATAYFLVANLSLCYLLPLAVILVCYGLIWKRVARREVPGEGRHNRRLVHRSKVKVVKMLFVVVLAFIISWLPLYAIFTRLKVGGPCPENSLEEWLIQVSAPVAQWLGASNSCINPVLYAFFNHRLREGFRSLLFGEKACCSTSSAVEGGGHVVRFSARSSHGGSLSIRRKNHHHCENDI